MWRRSHLPQRRAGAWASLLRAEGARPARPAGLPPPLHCLRGLRHVLGPLRVTPHWPAEFLRPPENLNSSQPTLCGSRSAPHGGARAGTAWDLRGQVGGGGGQQAPGPQSPRGPSPPTASLPSASARSRHTVRTLREPQTSQTSRKNNFKVASSQEE